jgi:preprotein translocase subunit SecF
MLVTRKITQHANLGTQPARKPDSLARLTGGVVVEVRFPTIEDVATIRGAFAEPARGDVKVQQVAGGRDMLITLGHDAGGGNIAPIVSQMLASKFPGSEVRRLDVVGARVSGELFHNGLVAISFALLAVLVYVWFRFDWQFGIGVVGTLLLDATKTIGFIALTQLPFDLNSVAAILLLIGYSVTDKIVVYDRIRENLRKFKTMPLRELIDLSINQTLGRTVATSLTVLLSILPLALIGGEAIRTFSLIMIFGIIVGTSSSIFIASPILLFLGQKRLRPAIAIEGAGSLASEAGP